MARSTLAETVSGQHEARELGTIESVQACLEHAGAKVEKTDTKLNDPAPTVPDLNVEFPPNDSVVVWVEDSEEAAQEIVDFGAGLSTLDGGQPETSQIRIGNAVWADFIDPVSDKTQTAVEDCLSGA